MALVDEDFFWLSSNTVLYEVLDVKGLGPTDVLGRHTTLGRTLQLMGLHLADKAQMQPVKVFSMVQL
jgi:hypothetical protein